MHETTSVGPTVIAVTSITPSPAPPNRFTPVSTTKYQAPSILIATGTSISASIISKKFAKISHKHFIKHFVSSMGDQQIELQKRLFETEFEAENLLLARVQIIENDKVRNGNREALTALRKIAKTTKTSVPSPFESMMKEIEGVGGGRALVKEVCNTCGNHDPKESTWMKFPGTDLFGCVPFHAAHTILEEDQTQLDYDSKKLQSYVKEKSLWLSEKGALSDKISPSVVRSMVTLTDSSK